MVMERDKFEENLVNGLNYSVRFQSSRRYDLTFELEKEARKRAKKKGVRYSLPRNHIERLIEQQNYKCALTGIPFSDLLPQGSTRRPFLPSVDRVKPEKGYTEENVRLVCMCVNYAMLDWGDWIIDVIGMYYLKGALGETKGKVSNEVKKPYRSKNDKAEQMLREF